MPVPSLDRTSTRYRSFDGMVDFLKRHPKKSTKKSRPTKLRVKNRKADVTPKRSRPTRDTVAIRTFVTIQRRRLRRRRKIHHL